MCFMCRTGRGFGFSCGILPWQPLERGGVPRSPVAVEWLAGTRLAALCTPAVLAITCCTAPPVETMVR